MQRRARPFEQVKARTADFYAPFKINNAQRLAQIPMGLERKIKVWRFAPLAYFYVVMLIRADWYAGIGHVGHIKLFVQQIGLNLAQRFIKLADFIAQTG